MVDNALLEQVMGLDADARSELRDAIEASVADEYLTPERAELLVARIAEDDEAAHEGYVTLHDLERETAARRSRHVG